MMVVENCWEPEECIDRSLSWFSKDLTEDKDFMMQALEKRPSLYFSKHFFLKEDFDITCLVIANVAILDHLSYWQQNNPFLEQIHQRTTEEIAMHLALDYIKA